MRSGGIRARQAVNPLTTSKEDKTNALPIEKTELVEDSRLAAGNLLTELEHFRRHG